MKLRAFLRTVLVSVALCLCGYPLFAQTPTVVSGTILDPNGLPYSYARVSAQLIPTTASPTILVGGIPVQIGGQQNATTDANGSFSMNLFCNISGGGCSAISPGGTQWQFTVTIAGIAMPFGTGPQFFSSTITISGATQSVSATLSAAAPALSRGNGAPIPFSGVPTGSCTSSQTAVDTTAGGHFYKCNGGVWQDVGPTAAGAVAWSSILAPTVNLALNHGAFTTTFTWGAATGAGVDLFNFTDTTNNTGTGHIFNVNLAPGSAAKPAQFAVNGNGVDVSNAGLLAKVGTGGLDYASLLNFPVACGANLFAKQIGATPGCTQPSFSNLSGTIVSAQFGSQSANTFLGAPNGSAGNPTFRALVGADIPAINLAASGNGGVTGTLPGANMAATNLAGVGNGGVTGTLSGANMSQVNLAGVGNGGVGGNLPMTNLCSGTGASASTFLRGDCSWATPTSPTPAILFGSCSGVANPNANLAPYGFGQIAATTCTQLFSDPSGTLPMPSAGTLKNLRVAASAGGISGLSGVVTVIKNNVATAVTCTLGTGTTCNDAVNTVAVVAGDRIGVTINTQPSETLANIRVTLEKQ